MLSFASAPDFEVPTDAGGDNVYNVDVLVSDGALIDTQSIAVTVTNVNEAPTITSAATVAVAENQVVAITVTGTDPDAETSLTYSILSGGDATLFSLDPSSGVLRFVVEPDYESGDSAYQVAVQVSDGVFADTQIVLVSITNVNDNAPVAMDDSLTVSENATVSSVIGAVDSRDADGTLNEITYNIISGNSDNAFALRSATGILTLARALDFETTPSYTLGVRVSDGTSSDTALIRVNVTDVFEFDSVPASITLTPASLRMLVGQDTALVVMVRNANGDSLGYKSSTLVWSSTTVTTASVASGKVHSEALGTAKVVVTLGALRDTCQVVVVGADSLVPPSKDTSNVKIGGGVTVEVMPSDTALRVKGKPYTPEQSEGISILGPGVDFLDSNGNATTLLGAVKVEIPADASKLPSGIQAKDLAVFVDQPGKPPVRLDNYLATGGSIEFLTSSLSRFYVGADTLAPKISIDKSSSVLAQNENATIDFTFTDNIANASVELLWKVGGDTTTHSRKLSGNDLDGQVALAYSDLRSRGATAWLKATDGTNESVTPLVDLIQALPPLAMDRGMPIERYDMFSVPFMNDSINVLRLLETQLGKYNPQKWRCYMSDVGSFAEITSDNNPKASIGRAYFLRTRGIAPSFVFDSLKTYPVSKPVQITLKPGWNSIATPFNYDISWSAVKAATGADSTKISGIYGFIPETKSWTRPDTTLRLKAWMGYMVKNMEDTVVVVKVPSLEWGATGSLAKTTVAAKSTQFIITATQAGQTPSVAYAGLSPLAKMGVDAQDQLLPPVPGARMSAYFVHNDWGKYSGRYMSDAQAPTDSLQTWNFSLSGFTPNQVMTLALEGVVPQGQRAWLVDQKSGRVTEWASSGVEVAAGNEATRQFSLILSKNAPEERSVARLFPGAGANLKVVGREVVWSIPESQGRGMVRVRVVGVDGSETAVIASELQDPGVYRATLPNNLPRGAGNYLVLQVNHKIVAKDRNLHWH